MCYWQLTLSVLCVCMMSYFSLVVEDLGENLLYLLVACNVMLSYKVVYKSMEKEEGGSNEHWKSTNKAYMTYKREV